jgi:hypothetical protein
MTSLDMHFLPRLAAMTRATEQLHARDVEDVLGSAALPTLKWHGVIAVQALQRDAALRGTLRIRTGTRRQSRPTGRNDLARQEHPSKGHHEALPASGVPTLVR